MRLLVCAAVLALLPAAGAFSLPSHHGSESKRAAAAWAHDHLQHWPPERVALAVTLIEKYGRPDDVSAHTLTWYNNGPWKRTELFRDGTPHNFPLPHLDVLEQTISYRVPPKLIGDLAEYDGSLVVDRTRGELSVHSDSEEENIITLNIAHDILTGNRTVDEAKAYHAQVVEGLFIHDPETYQLKLLFKPEKSAADPAQEAELLQHLNRH